MLATHDPLVELTGLSTMAKRKMLGATSASNREKGSLVEDIAAAMYRLPGFDVQTRVRVSPRGGVARKSERREVDVLITLTTPGLPMPVQMVVECKNEKEPIEPELIDAFAGKLDDIGIHRGFGLFVSTSRYTSGALRRAQKEGIRTLLLVTDPVDQLPDEIRRLIQPVVFVLPRIDEIRLASGIDLATDGSDAAFVLRHADGSNAGTVIDLVWAEWLRGKLPLQIGKLRMESIQTHGRGHVVAGLFSRIEALSADLTLEAHMIELPGAPTRHRLIDAASRQSDRERVEVMFRMRPATYDVMTTETETDLMALLRQRNPLNLPVVRVPIPRVKYETLLWPPSVGTASKLTLLGRAMKAGVLAGPAEIMREMHQPNLEAGFDPIWADYPALDLIPSPQGGTADAPADKPEVV